MFDDTVIQNESASGPSALSGLNVTLSQDHALQAGQTMSVQTGVGGGADVLSGAYDAQASSTIVVGDIAAITAIHGEVTLAGARAGSPRVRMVPRHPGDATAV